MQRKKKSLFDKMFSIKTFANILMIIFFYPLMHILKKKAHPMFH